MTDFKPSKAQRAAIAVAAAAGMSHRDIAETHGTTAKVLEATCRDELTTQASQVRFAVIDAMHKAALKGNVTAARAFLARPADCGGPLNRAATGVKERRKHDAVSAADATEWQDVAGRAN